MGMARDERRATSRKLRNEKRKALRRVWKKHGIREHSACQRGQIGVPDAWALGTKQCVKMQ